MLILECRDCQISGNPQNSESASPPTHSISPADEKNAQGTVQFSDDVKLQGYLDRFVDGVELD